MVSAGQKADLLGLLTPRGTASCWRVCVLTCVHSCVHTTQLPDRVGELALENTWTSSRKLGLGLWRSLDGEAGGPRE